MVCSLLINNPQNTTQTVCTDIQCKRTIHAQIKKVLSEGVQLVRGGPIFSEVECRTRDREAADTSLTGVTALWSLGKTHLS